MLKKVLSTFLKFFLMSIGVLGFGISNIILLSNQELSILGIIIWFLIGTIGGTVYLYTGENFEKDTFIFSDAIYSFMISGVCTFLIASLTRS